jgi:pyruvate/2-oxoglutarate dehydrogenase complex dihydrolipoamide acyltransferase (E2) component
MLSSTTLHVPQAGVVQLKLKLGDAFRAGTVVALIRTAAGLTVEVRSPVDGELQAWDVPDGATVSAGQPMARLSPNEDQVWEALRGLYLVGGEQDLEAVKAYAQGGKGISLRVKHQAEMTAQAIHNRMASQHTPS